MRTSEQINELAKAMSLAQGMMKPAAKDSINPHFKIKFADIASIWDSIRKPLADNQLSVFQDVVSEDKAVLITTRLMHSSGQWIEFGPLSIPVTKQDAQGFGSATTYAKRYSLCAALGIVSGDEDDDGEAAVKAQPAQSVRTVITKEQYGDLMALLQICPKELKDTIEKAIKKPPHNAKGFDDIPANAYDKLMSYITEEMKKI